MILMCCHPSLPEESRVALTLKTVCALSVAEIARAFLTTDEAIAQRIVRAKRLIRDQGIAMAMPSVAELCHAMAQSFEDTDWPRVAELYDELMIAHPSPVVALNRAIAIAMIEGPSSGIAEIRTIAASGALRDYLPLEIALAELSMRAGDPAGAAAHFSRALELPATTAEKRFILWKLNTLR